ncbi:hypothetical protein KKI95_12830 [Xenorhabdus bovienii]|uniref:Tc toxin subunit A-related protein n=2 Tax=Xenorhabdus bovienii TaxID=40576 RepID=UPI0023B24D1B|nr:Tc toxin subunit A [Xenorhabdus bovienii]MDE9436786.1 hypothetical protein [Xenorhabdus bovienii]MDE9498511.1 hypothetical protein [Xenorhabdus bovienii]
MNHNATETDTISPLITRTEQIHNVDGQLTSLGYASVFDIVRIPREQFIKKHRHSLGRNTGKIYDLAIGYAHQIARSFRKSCLTRAVGQSLRGPFSVSGPDYSSQFPAEVWTGLSPAGAPEANDGVVHYAAVLYQLALEREGDAGSNTTTMNRLEKRRPDISSLIVDDKAINEEIPQLQVVTEVLSAAIRATDAENLTGLSAVNEKLSTSRYPNSFPFDFGHTQIQAAQREINQTLQALTQSLDADMPSAWLSPTTPLAGDNLARQQVMACGLGPEQQRILIETDDSLSGEGGKNLPAFYESNFGDANLGAYNFADMTTLTSRTGLTVPEVEQLLSTTAGGPLVIASPNSGELETGASMYGSTYILGLRQPAIAIQKDDATGGLSLSPAPTDTQLMHINRMVRLQRQLELPYEDVDLLLMSSLHAAGSDTTTCPLDDNTLRMLGIFKSYRHHYGTTAKQFSAWLYQLSPYAITPATPFFDQIFNADSTFDTPFQADGSDFNYRVTDGVDGQRSKHIMAALGLNQRQFLLLADRVAAYQNVKGAPDGTLKCDLSAATAFYRIATLAKTLGLTVDEFCALIDILDADSGVVWKQLAGNPVIKMPGSKVMPASDVLSLLQTFQMLTQWLQRTLLQVTTLVLLCAPLPATTGTDAQLSFIQQIWQRLPATFVTADLFSRSGAPLREDDGDNSADIDWFSLLAAAELIDADGLVTDNFTAEALQTIVEGQALSDASKALAVTALSAALLQLQTTQSGIAITALAQALNVSQSLPVQLLRWAGVTPYRWLSDTWSLNTSVTTADTLPAAWLTMLRDIARRSMICSQFQLSPAGLKAWLDNPDWFSLSDTEKTGAISLQTLYRMSRYHALLTQVGGAAYAEDDLLAYLRDMHAGTALTPEVAASTLASLLGWDASEVAAAFATNALGHTAATLADLDVLMSLQQAGQDAGLTVEQLVWGFTLSRDGDYAAWFRTGQDMVTGVRYLADLKTLDSVLAEAQRDALVTAYKAFVAPTLNGVTGPISDEDMYEYLLLDMNMSADSMTSRLASAVDSLQTYISRIINNSEPGHTSPVSSVVDDWRDFYCRYDIWAAGTAVVNYPNNYISPVTRQDVSQYFDDLKNTLNQNQLDSDRVMDAALAYLNDFEGVSNLEVINGYITQTGMAGGDNLINDAKFYFIGRTTTKPYQYYWRMMDLSKNQSIPAGKPVTPNCWSDWAAIDLPLSGDGILEHTIRPTFYNNRLYLCWATRDATPRAGAGTKFLEGNGGNLAMDGTEYYAYGLSYAYLRFDGKWTAPNTADMVTNVAIAGNSDDENIALSSQLLIQGKDEGKNQSNVVSLFTRDTTVEESAAGDAVSGDESEYGRLFMSLMVYPGKQGDPVATYAYRYGDSAFNRRSLNSTVRTLLFAKFTQQGWINGKYTNPLQFALNDVAYRVKSVEYLPGMDYKSGVDTGDAWLNALKRLDSSDITVSDDGLTLKMTASTTAKIQHFLGYGLGSCRTSPSYFKMEEKGTGKALLTVKRDSKTGKWYFHNTIITNDRGKWKDSQTRLTLVTTGPRNGIAPVLIGGDTLDIRSDSYLKWTRGSSYNPTLDLSNLEIDPDFLDFDDSGDKSTYFAVESSDSPIRVIARPNDVGKVKSEALIAAPDPDWLGRMGMWIAKVNNNDPVDFTNLYTWRDKYQNTIDAGYTFSGSRVIKKSDFPVEAKALQYVIQVNYFWEKQGNTPSDYVAKHFLVTLEAIESVDDFTPPTLVKRYDSKKGMVQKLAFNDKSLPADTRLNTTFVRELIAQAGNGLGSLLNYALQAQELEADLDTDGASAHIDFDGANGLYFWELFFHLPFMVAWRFNSEQQLNEAQTWLHYIFDPSVKEKEGGAPDYWNCYPITLRPENSLALSRLSADPINPDTQAYADPELYQKAVFMAYVSNLITQGDAWYRQLTRDTLAQARIMYNQVATLLGPRPDAVVSSDWLPQTLRQLTSSSSALRAYERLLPARSTVTLPALRGANHGTLRDSDNAAFTAPLNSALLSYWDTLDARLYNLRHNLTVDGKPMSLALYATPADPTALLVQRAQGGALVGGLNSALQIVSPYRFNAVLPRAYNAVATLSRFGESLLSLLERSERAGQEELAQQHLLDMSSYVLTLQQQSIDGLAADRTALLASQATAQQRLDYYSARYDENISSGEQRVMDLLVQSRDASLQAQAFHTLGGALQLTPTVFGLANGSLDPGAPATATGALLSLNATATNNDAMRLEQTEGYRRRRQEWELQRDQADSEVQALNKQLDALDVRIRAAQTALEQEVVHQAQTQAMLTYLKTRFTQATLYQWLSGQLSALYYQAYDAVVSLCLSAQACWQYEIGDFTTTFIQTGAWNDQYRGLLVGETLQLNLQQMEAAWLARNERRLNIVRTVSLKALVGKDSWGKFKTTGTLDFTLTEALFDNDYAGHYLRTLKTVTVTLPTLLGPYQDVKATLTQTRSTTVLKADKDAVRTLIEGQGNAPVGTLVQNLRPSQQIALSGGLNDAGTFELEFSDERYLPFEGTGAISGWTLSFPRTAGEPLDGGTLAADPQQAALLAALDDVIVQVRYTACDGGATFAKAVKSLLLPAS